jgi:chromate transport protein ChrA
MAKNLQGSHADKNHPPTENLAVEPRQANPVHGKPLEVFQIFLKIGLTAFGGPIAHLGYFEREIIERRKWLTQNAFGDLVALCQFLPGPASSQVAFALGYLREKAGSGETMPAERDLHGGWFAWANIALYFVFLRQ